jgi:hypothetical protein
MWKKYFPLIPLLALSLTLAACKIHNSSADSYTFKFRIQCNTTEDIKRVDFINGSRQDAPTLDWETDTLSNGEMSDEYEVSGFTEQYGGDNKHIYGVLITLDDDSTVFDWSTATHQSKVLVTVYSYGYSYKIKFSQGVW